MKRAWKGYALIAPMLAGFLLFYVVPFGQVMWDSLSQGTGKSQLFVGFYNYQRMFQNKMFLAAFGNTLKFWGWACPWFYCWPTAWPCSSKAGPGAPRCCGGCSCCPT